MYLGILVEQLFTSSSWFDQMYVNLIKTAKIKRITYKRYDSLEELTDEQETIAHIVIIGSDYKWLDDALKVCDKKNSNIILYSNGNTINREFNFRCNVLSSDIAYSVSQTLSLFEDNNRSCFALYAINPRSPADKYLLQLYSKIINEEDVFYNNGKLDDCFNEFAVKSERYDSVICANDYSAISLLNNLKKTNPERIYDLFIVSYSDLLISKYYSPAISTFSMNFSEFGQATMFICDYFDNPHANKSATLSIKIPCIFNSRTTTRHALIPDVKIKTLLPTSGEKSGYFTEDLVVNEITNLESLLTNCDEIDHRILKMWLDNQTSTNISEALFISRSTLRYRINKILNYSKCETKNDVIKLLNKYNISF